MRRNDTNRASPTQSFFTKIHITQPSINSTVSLRRRRRTERGSELHGFTSLELGLQTKSICQAVYTIFTRSPHLSPSQFRIKWIDAFWSTVTRVMLKTFDFLTWILGGIIGEKQTLLYIIRYHEVSIN